MTDVSTDGVTEKHMSRIFRVKSHGDMYKWYRLQERKFFFFWVDHYKYYNTFEEAKTDVENMGGRLI